MLALLREISLRHFVRSPLRSLLVVVGIALGIALYVATEAAAASMLAAFSEFVARVSGRADLTIEAPGLGVPGELVAQVAETPGVLHAAASLEATARAPELQQSLLVLGVDFLGDLHFLPFKVDEGEQRVIEDPLAFVNDPTALLLSRQLATRHGLTQGSRIALLTAEGPKDFFVRGVLEDRGAAASFGGQVAVMFIDAAQVSFARGTFVDRIDVAAAPGVDVARLQARLQQLVGRRIAVERPARLGVRLRSLTQPLHVALWVSGFMALLVGAFLVYNAVGVAVAQRRRETGVLRALGVTRRGVTALFCAEAGLLSLPGIALGLGLGQWLSQHTARSALDAVDRLYASVPQVAPRLTPALIVQSIAAGLGMAVLAAWLPARRGAALDPALVIRGTAAAQTAPPRARRLLLWSLPLFAAPLLPGLQQGKLGGALSISCSVLGAALATPAVVIALRAALVPLAERLLGVPGRLGLDYVERTLGRSTVNVLALMVAVSTSVAMGGWLTSFERSIGSWASQVGVADLTVTQGSPVLDRRHVPFDPGAIERLSRLPMVKAVQRFRMIDQPVRGQMLRLVATDTDTFLQQALPQGKGWQVVEGEPLQVGELRAAPRLLLSENAARLVRARAGDSLTLSTPKGDVAFSVRAVIVDYTSEAGAIFIDQAHFQRHYGDLVVDGAFVFVRPGVSTDVAADAVRRELSGEHAGTVFVTKTKEVERHIVQTLHETFSYSRSVEAMTLLIALMGVIGTMASAVIDRKRELAMLRAIGATSGQVAGSIVAEAGFLGLCAAAAGIAVGLFECRIFMQTMVAAQTGWHLDFVLPIAAIARTALLVVVTSALAGGLPALRAARTETAAATGE